MTWTRRKTTDLLRLLEEYKREHFDVTDYGDPIIGIKIGDIIDRVIADIEFMEPSINRGLGDDHMLEDIAWWCGIVRDRYGWKRHTALTWLMQQYYDKEGKQTFSRKWGASVDSVARRLGQKVKYHKPDTRRRKDREQRYAAVVKEEGVDIYRLTFELLKLWPKPGSCSE